MAASLRQALMRAVVLGCVAACASVTLADPSQLKLHDDFEGDGFAPGGGLYYKDNEEQRAGGFRTQTDVARSGRRGLELAVGPRCRPEQRGCSERAEVWEKREVLAGYDRTLWYAFSMKLDDPPPAASQRHMVAQWKREIKPGAKGDYSPYLGLRIVRGAFAITIDSDEMPARPRGPADPALGCAEGATPANQRAQAKQTRLLIAGSDGDAGPIRGFQLCAPDIRLIDRGGRLPKVESKWIDFVFKVKPGPRGDGEIEIFANGAWVVSAKGRIGHESDELGDTQYFKFGPYRDGGRTDTWRVFYDDFRRGPACEDVADAALCGRVKGS